MVMIIVKKYRLLLIAISLFMIDFGLSWYFINFTSYAEEGNPLFLLNIGYISYIINFIYIIAVLMIGKTINHYQTIQIASKNSFDYIKKLFQSDRTDFIVLANITAFVYATFASRLTAILDWIIYGIYQDNFDKTQYAIVRSMLPFDRYDTLVIFVSFLIFLLLWFKVEHQKSNALLLIKEKHVI